MPGPPPEHTTRLPPCSGTAPFGHEACELGGFVNEAPERPAAAQARRAEEHHRRAHPRDLEGPQRGQILGHDPHRAPLVRVDELRVVIGQRGYVSHAGDLRAHRRQRHSNEKRTPRATLTPCHKSQACRVGCGGCTPCGSAPCSAAPRARRRLADAAALAVDRDTVLLVIAPHPDDETLCCAGVMQRVLSAGGHVSVLWLTSGDGSELGSLLIEKSLFANPEKMRSYGAQRMQEARTATALLGVPAAGQLFLGYPDGGHAAAADPEPGRRLHLPLYRCGGRAVRGRDVPRPPLYRRAAQSRILPRCWHASNLP